MESIKLSCLPALSVLMGSERNEELRIVGRVMFLATLTLPLFSSPGLSFFLYFLCMPQTSTLCLLQSYISHPSGSSVLCRQGKDAAALKFRYRKKRVTQTLWL